jgi:hypothetical protein
MTEKGIEIIAKACFERYFDSKLRKLHTNAEEMMENFVKFEKSRIGNYKKPVFIEKMLEDDIFRGKIDFFDGTTIVDWKTGSIMDIDDDMKRQGKIYDVLLNNNGYTGKFRILFVTSKNGRTLELPMVTTEWLMSHASRMQSIVSSGNYPKCRTPLCDWCEAQLRCECSDYSLWDGMLQDGMVIL